jgi:hypothetical protein
LLRYLVRNQAAAALHRPVTVGDINFNPYTLRLAMADLHVGGSSDARQFIDISLTKLRLSWSSLSHLALVIKELTIERPSIQVARLAPKTFDFSDLLSASPEGRGTKDVSFAFAVSNIEVKDGLITFDDRVLKKTHRLENIQLAIPFIANLPTDADNYVQPRLQMSVDGSPFKLIGETKPFRGNLEWTVDGSCQKLDLTPFAGYVVERLPFKLKQAELSAALKLKFIQAPGQPQLETEGTLTLDNVAITDLHDSPLAELKQLRAGIARFEPLAARVHFSSIGIDSLSSHLVVNHDGRTNLSSVFGGYRAQAASSKKPGLKIPAESTAAPKITTAKPQLFNPMAAASQRPTPGAQTPGSGMSNYRPAASESPFALSVDSLQLNNSTLDFADRSGAEPVGVKLQAIHLGLKNFTTVGGTPASYSFGASLETGGRVTASGSFDPLSVRTTAKLAIANIELPALRGLIARMLPATIASGRFSAQGTVRAALHPHFNLQAEQARITLDEVDLRPPAQVQSILGWKQLTANVEQFDLASHRVVVRELRSSGLHLTALRDSRGSLNLASLLVAQPRVNEEAAEATTGTGSPSWQYRIESLVVESADAALEDDTNPQPISFRIAPLNVHLNEVTSDFAKPFTIEADGNMAQRGTFKIAGESAINPFQSRFHITTQRIDAAWLDPLIAGLPTARKLNAKITNVRLDMDGDAQAQFRDGKVAAVYRGDVTLANVRLNDKLTGVSFLRWFTLKLRGLVMSYGPARPSIQVDSLALSDFYARLILNADGRLNLSDIVSSPSRPVSITRPTSASPSEIAGATVPADIRIAVATLGNGQLDYLDNFIKPNYSVVITQLEGRIGTIGTSSTEAADVLLAGKVNRTSPVTISGSINPLAPMASLDLQGNASRIQLSPLTPYSAKYTGYPITGGTLSGTVHYKLASQHLSATNDLILDQLSFGERVENSSARNLPMRLAVAVLKDSQGRIDLRIPVAGSLSDPNFDLGKLIWQGLVNVIEKAAAAPFKMLASVIGGEGHNLSYVAFAPGYSTLSPLERDKLATLATLLQQRPWLKLQISGRVDPKLDSPGLRDAILEDEIKRRKAEDERLNIASDAVEQVEVTPDEYNKYLRRVYRAADFAKPGGVLGIVKSQPTAEMKKLLLANIKVTPEDLRHLAEARAATVYQTLSTTIAPPRLIVVPPKLSAEGISEGPTTRVDFALE